VTDIRRLAVIWLLLVLLVPIVAGTFMAENTLHPSAPTASATVADSVSRATRSTYRDVQIRTTDGTALQAWLFIPPGPPAGHVVVLHGVGDSRAGMHRIIRMLLSRRYAVLAPDSRPGLTTYGIREAADVHLWAEYLYRTQPVQNLYGLGESMGAAVLLQSLPSEPRFRAVVAECPFSTFPAIARDRIEQNLHSDSLLARAIAEPVLASGLLYTRMRYGVDLTAASPLDAVRHSEIPILLIHGLRDSNVSPQHSRILLLANPRHIVPWFVPKAGHVGAFSADPAVFEERVTSFFQTYQR
jgi:dipeptidyl aminopeptidase/acylaminoacyl peptidase